MALNEQEKQACRYYLGYPQIAQGHSLSLGIPDKTQLNFILEGNMDELLPIAEQWVRRAIQELACIEDQKSKLRTSVEVKRVTGAVEMRHGDAFLDLDDRHREWIAVLSDSLGAPPNPFSNQMTRLGIAGGIQSGVVEPT